MLLMQMTPKCPLQLKARGSSWMGYLTIISQSRTVALRAVVADAVVAADVLVAPNPSAEALVAVPVPLAALA